jgi:tetratricopeptide (TPR) repeat protein
LIIKLKEKSMNIKCAICGGNQKFTQVPTCYYCENFIEIGDAPYFLKPTISETISKYLYRAQKAIDDRNWEEAIFYFKKILKKDIKNSDAWFGIGFCTIRTSTLANLKFNEAITYWEYAINCASNPSAMRKRITKEVNNLVGKFYLSIENHFLRFIELNKSYYDYLSRFLILESAINYASELNPENYTILENGFDLCVRVSSFNSPQNKSIYFSMLEKGKISEGNSLCKSEKLDELVHKYSEKITKIKPIKIKKMTNKD